MLEIREFAQKVYRAMKKELGEEYSVELKEMCKNNGVVLQGLLITSKECNVAPTIYLDPFWEIYQNGATFADIVRRLLEICRKEAFGKNIDMKFFREFDKVKDRICYRLVSRRANRELLLSVPHIDFLDLAVCFFYAYHGEELGEGSILIYNTHMEMWHTNPLELLKLAEKNTARLFPCHIFSMEDVLKEFISEQPDSLSEAEEYREFLNRVPMRILSNEQKNQGAACLLYEGVLEKLARIYGKSFYVLPSSIHEVILLPDSGYESAQELRDMIHEVNSTQLSPEEILSDKLYYYDFYQKGLKIF